MAEKKFIIQEKNIKKILETDIGCIASDMITVEGLPVLYMYRQNPTERYDSGWRFFAGIESQEYADNHENFSFYKINTIANYDQSIIAYLDLPIGTALERENVNDKFVIVEE
jgi:hypothetical protein